MANFNKVLLIGRLTQDPELRYTAGVNAAVTDLRLAVNRMIPTKDGGEPREEVLFIDVTVWNRQAENCCNYLKKGRQVHIEGHLKQDSWEDKVTGEKRTKVKVEAEWVQFLDPVGRRDDSAGMDDSQSAPPSRRPAAPGGANNGAGGPSRSFSPPPTRRPAPTPEPDGGHDEPEEEDIPF